MTRVRVITEVKPKPKPAWDKNIAAKLRLGRAYSALLMVPHDTQTRDIIQPALALIRDEIARLANRDPEAVQVAYEARADAGKVAT